MRPTKMPRQQLGQIMTPDCSGALEDSGLANCRRCALPRVIAWQSGALPAISKTGSGARPGGHPLMKPDCRKDCAGVTGAPRPQRGASGDRGSLARDETFTLHQLLLTSQEFAAIQNNVLALFSDWSFGNWARSVRDQANQARSLYRDLSRPAHYHRGSRSARGTRRQISVRVE